MRAKYAVRVERAGDWWAIDVPEIPGVHTQARRLEKVEATARDAIAIMLDVPADAFDLAVSVELGVDFRALLEATTEARQRAEVAQVKASESIREATAVLLAAGLTVRDTGELLGVSHQRVAQLARTPAPRRSATRLASRSAWTSWPMFVTSKRR